MASHSEHSAVIRGYTQTLGVAQGPIDAGMVRDAIVNNSRHLHDECGQALLTLARTTGEYWTQASPSTSSFQLLDAFPIVEFPVHRRDDTGLSFLVIALARVSISVAGTATFRVALHPGAGAVDPRFPPVYSASGAAVAEFTTTNTTGEDVAVSALHFTGAMLDAARTANPSKRGDGSLGSGTNFVGALSVWAKSSAGAPRLHSICAREYVGA